jgi:hypothetical protein
MARSIFWVLLLAAPLLFLGLHCSAASAHKEWAEVLRLMDTSPIADIPTVAWRKVAPEGSVKIRGTPSARVPAPLPFSGMPVAVAYYRSVLVHEYEDDDRTERTTAATWTGPQLEIAEGSDAWIRVDMSNTCRLLPRVDKRELGSESVTRSGDFATIVAGSHTARVELRGDDELWLESEWIEMGDPLFAIGVLVRDAEGFSLQASPTAPLIVSARDEATTRLVFGACRDDGAFYEVLARTALVAPVTGAIGPRRVRED